MCYYVVWYLIWYVLGRSWIKSCMCWSYWWMMRRSDVEVGSSPIFLGFLAPHDHNIFPPWFHVLCPLLWSPLGHCCLYWVYVEYLARFDNFYEIIDLCWILSEFFHHPLRAWVKHLCEVLIFWWRHWFELLWLYEDGISWFWRLWSMLLRVFVFAIHLWF